MIDSKFCNVRNGLFFALHSDVTIQHDKPAIERHLKKPAPHFTLNSPSSRFLLENIEYVRLFEIYGA